ncbi:MAG: NAD(P)/FAD-dependent oxidoreductase [Gammaproteobacteria bacterium]|nr:NAD(P)/FAD-dependent oxidoreductase [Gammaproteobacteria bacterium]
MPTNDTNHYDLLIIGSGPAGYKAAVTASMYGAKVAIIEKSLPGGTCLNQGCVPKDALVRIAKLLRDFSSYAGHGISGQISGDFSAAIKHKNETIAGIRATLIPWLKQLGIKLHEGSASFVDEHTLKVVKDNITTVYTADKIVIATGGRPKELNCCPRDGEHILNTTDFMFKLDTMPTSMLFVGGGTVSCELAYALHQFGCKVSIVEQSERLLNKPCINERASQTLERKFKRLGIAYIKNTQVSSSRVEAGGVEVTLNDGQCLRFEKVLVAVGRVPNVESLNLDAAGIHLHPDGFIQTNEYLETSCKGVYAIGDVKHGPMTANGAFHDAKIAANNAINGNSQKFNYNRVPMVIDTALQIASVGLTEDRAEQAGFEVEVARINLAGSTKAKTSKDLEGYIEVVHDDETGQLLGGTIVGPQAGEMVHTLTAACQSNRGLWFFTDMSYAHPSWSEELENAIGRYVAAFNNTEDDIFRPGIYAIHR